MSAIILKDIVKWYGKDKTLALKSINLEVADSELFGLIGPDGAGKSSLFRILTTLLLPDQGEASVLGKDVVKDYKFIRRSVGYMPGRFSLYQDLTVEENLRFFATVFGTSVEENYDLIKDIYELLEPFKDRPAGKLSGGMKQKLALSCALIHQPKVLFLDEPTTGVDPVSRKEFWEILKRLKGKGITILVSTPYMDEARMCDRVALIHQGELLTVDTPDGVSGSFTDRLFELKIGNISKVLDSLRESPGIKSCHSFGDSLHITPYPDTDERELVNIVDGLGLQDYTLEGIRPDIEDCFMSFMSR